MKTIIKEFGSESELHISDDMMDNDNFVTLYLTEGEHSDSPPLQIDVVADELLRAIQSYVKK